MHKYGINNEIIYVLNSLINCPLKAKYMKSSFVHGGQWRVIRSIAQLEDQFPKGWYCELHLRNE